MSFTNLPEMVYFQNGALIKGQIPFRTGSNLESQVTHTHPKKTKSPPPPPPDRTIPYCSTCLFVCLLVCLFVCGTSLFNINDFSFGAS